MTNPALYKATAPAVFRAKFTTTKGDFVIEVTRAWAPHGADRFYNLAKGGYFDGAPIYRVIPNFMAQFGFSPVPSVSKAWDKATIMDDPVTQSNKRGYITYAKPEVPPHHNRTTQLFINYKDNAFLDSQGFAPFGQVVEGMDVVDKFYSAYGDTDQGKLADQGIAYVKASLPKLDIITSTAILPAAAPATPAPPKK
jgi:peptidyl-prolyl cis-trans isomerase A (cyclophilin A)